MDLQPRSTIIARLLTLAIIPALVFSTVACDSTPLDQEPEDSVTPEKFFNNEEEFLSAAAAVYSIVRSVTGASGSTVSLEEHTSDEIMVPTRGPNWGDNGVWRALTQHNWSVEHPNLNGAWSTQQTGISRSNSVLTSLARSESLSEQRKAEFEAEMRFLRSFFYYWLMDLYGGVPIVVEEGSDLDFPKQPVSADNPPPQNTRKEVYDFILQELTGCTSDNFEEGCVTNPASESVLANLPTSQGVQDHGRVRLGAGYAFLARLLINSEIYSGTPQNDGIETGVELYEEAAAAADQVINSGSYSLADKYSDNFTEDNYNSPEIIFAATYKPDLGSGNLIPRTQTHPNMPTGISTWNGFTTIAEFYEAFENVPEEGGVNRQDQIMSGPRYQEPSSDCWGNECFSDPSSEPVTIRGRDDQVTYPPEIPSITLEGNATELENPGARPFKLGIGSGPSSQGGFGNDTPLFRLAEMYLIKAEARAKTGDIQGGVTSLNILREARGADLVEGSPSQMELIQLTLQERGYEFLFEMQRRQDLIRYEFAHGGDPIGFEQSSRPNAEVYAPTFTGPWLFKEESDGCRALFPIPSEQLSTNPNLQQNPGYPGCGDGKP
jgi:hypothetical protein